MHGRILTARQLEAAAHITPRPSCPHAHAGAFTPNLLDVHAAETEGSCAPLTPETTREYLFLFRVPKAVRKALPNIPAGMMALALGGTGGAG